MASHKAGDIARDMVVAFGLSRALRMVRLHHGLHRQTRHFVLAAWGGALAVSMTGMFPNYTPINVDRDGTRGLLWSLSGGQVTKLYRILIGMWFMYQLDTTPTLRFTGFTHPSTYNIGNFG